MELKDFIKETVNSINQAVKELQDNKIGNEEINPIGARKAGISLKNKEEDYVYLSEIEFNVVLSSDENKSGSIGIGVWFANVGLGAKENSSNTTNNVTAIKFIIPVSYPTKK